MDVISRTLFSAPISGDTRVAADAVQVLSEAALREMFWPRTLPDWLPLPGKSAKRQARQLIHGLIRAHLDERQYHPDGNKTDLLNMLLVLRNAEGGDASVRAGGGDDDATIDLRDRFRPDVHRAESTRL